MKNTDKAESTKRTVNDVEEQRMKENKEKDQDNLGFLSGCKIYTDHLQRVKIN